MTVVFATAEIISAVSAVFLIAGTFFAFTGAVGMLRMPDFFSRVHPAGKTDTLAQTLFMVGLLLQASGSVTGIEAIKLVMITALLFLTTPTATHAITQAAYKGGLRPTEKSGESPSKNDE